MWRGVPSHNDHNPYRQVVIWFLYACCAGYVEHPFKKEAHGDERSGFTLLADGLIPEGPSGRNACARWHFTSISSAQQELQERDPTQATRRFLERMLHVASTTP